MKKITTKRILGIVLSILLLIGAIYQGNVYATNMADDDKEIANDIEKYKQYEEIGKQLNQSHNLIDYSVEYNESDTIEDESSQVPLMGDMDSENIKSDDIEAKSVQTENIETAHAKVEDAQSAGIELRENKSADEKDDEAEVSDSDDSQLQAAALYDDEETQDVTLNEALAISSVASINSCKISSGNVVVQATINNSFVTADGKVYLFELQPYEKSIGDRSDYVSCKDLNTNVTFDTPLGNGDSSKLYSKFMVAYKKANGSYEGISYASYITNPEAVATYNYSFPTGKTKKGLLVETSMGAVTDAKELGVEYTNVNIPYNHLLVTGNSGGEKINYTYDGTTYYFNKPVIEFYDEFISGLTRQGIIINAILLNGANSAVPELISSDITVSDSRFYYNFNVDTPEGVRALKAITKFLVERYSSDTNKDKYGQIVNWIVGNEIDSDKIWNYAGNRTLESYTREYTTAFRIIYNIARSTYSNARVYVSLDYFWNKNAYNLYTGKDILNTMQTIVSQEGAMDYNIAYHPYPNPLTEAVFWDDGEISSGANNSLVTSDSENSEIITMNNLSVLTNYLSRNSMKNADGSTKRVILTEQGFTSTQSSSGDYGKLSAEEQEKLQAAAYAYAYYLAESNSGVDSFVISRQVDSVDESGDGLTFGLWKMKNQMPSSRKMVWNVFKYIDTDKSLEVTDFAKSVIGINNWSQVVSSIDSVVGKFTKSISTADMSEADSMSGSTEVPNNWEAQYSVAKNNFKYTFLGSDGAFYRTVQQNFDTPIDFSDTGKFNFNLFVSEKLNSKAAVQVRFYSGDNVLEAESVVGNEKDMILSVDLSEWKYKDSVNKIVIGVRQSDTSSAKDSDAYFIMSTKNESNSTQEISITTEIKNITQDGYTIVAATKGLGNGTTLYFPTWTEKDGQDDIVWSTATVDNGSATCKISINQHNNESGTYNTHVYYNNERGDMTFVDAKSIDVPANANNVTTEPVKPTESPKVLIEMTSCEVSNITSEGYTVTARITGLDNGAEILFPTWTDKNGQDDLTWGSARLNNGKVIYNIRNSAHNDESGTYNTHVYYTDSEGNLNVLGGIGATVPKSAVQKIEMTSCEVSNESSKGYTVTARVTGLDNGTEMVFPTWTDRNDQDDLTWGSARLNNGKVIYNVTSSMHNNESGQYITHVYYTDSEGDLHLLGGIDATVLKASKEIEMTSFDVSDNTSTGYTISCDINGLSNGTRIYFPTWTEKNDQDDLTWGTTLVNNGMAKYRVFTSHHNKEKGLYNTHVYYEDAYGELHILGGNTITVK